MDKNFCSYEKFLEYVKTDTKDYTGFAELYEKKINCKEIEHLFVKYNAFFLRIEDKVDSVEYLEIEQSKELLNQLDELIELSSHINKLIRSELEHPQIIFLAKTLTVTTKFDLNKILIYNYILYRVNQNIIDFNTNNEYIILEDINGMNTMKTIMKQLNIDFINELSDKILEKTLTISLNFKDIINNIKNWFKPLKNKV